MTRILQITDVHLVAPPQLVSNKLSTYDIFKDAIDRIRVDLKKFEKIDAILVTGDITDTGDIESYYAFREQIERLTIPYFLIPGNHDLKESMLTCFSDKLTLDAKTQKINWVHDFDDIRLIGLDTSVPNVPGGILDDLTLAFLSESLLKAQGKPVLIALHHPPFQSGNHFMDNIGLDGIVKLEAILSASNNDIRLVSGHLHSNIVATIGNKVAMSSVAISSAFLTDYRKDAPIGFSTDPRGYMIHEWDNGFRSTSIPLITGTGPHPF